MSCNSRSIFKSVFLCLSQIFFTRREASQYLIKCPLYTNKNTPNKTFFTSSGSEDSVNITTSSGTSPVPPEVPPALPPKMSKNKQIQMNSSNELLPPPSPSPSPRPHSHNSSADETVLHNVVSIHVILTVNYVCMAFYCSACNSGLLL